MGFLRRIRNGWNAFLNKDPTGFTSGATYNTYGSSSIRPDRKILSRYNGRSIMAPAINRIATDISMMSIEHVKANNKGEYEETVESSLNDLFNYSANVDQTGQAFIEDIVISLCDEGTIAVVPIDTEGDPMTSDNYKVLTARVGKIVAWYPSDILVEVYNDRTGHKENLLFPKRVACIIDNPFYYLMNDYNSTLQRLLRKLSLLDEADERNSGKKLDLIIQLPYVIKGDKRREQAELRKRGIEEQLIDSPYGIAYIDGTERIIQLNRPAENTLVEQINDLKADFYNQLGLTQAIFDGTADEATMINYENRTLSVIANAIINEIRRKWISQEARKNGETIMVIKDPFRNLTVSQIAEAADKFTRNEILSSNEIRSRIGYKPSDDPDADVLRNKNLNKSKEDIAEENQNGNKTNRDLEKLLRGED